MLTHSKKYFEKGITLDEEYTNEEEFEDTGEPQVIVEPDFRVSALFGDVNTRNAKELLATFLVFKESEIDPETGEKVCRPFDFYISTSGGNAADMFAIYDLMRLVQETTETEIHTIGVGKVMSAGVLLLAAGTKGKRKISRNCRVMIHAAEATYFGSTNSAQIQLQEVQMLEKMLIDALVQETKMSKKFLRNIINKDENYYLGAEKAVKLGIADIIV